MNDKQKITALVKALEELMETARVAMSEANNDGAEYNLDLELADYRKLIFIVKEGNKQKEK